MDAVTLDGKGLSIGDVVRIAHAPTGSVRVTLDGEARARVARTAQAVADLLARGEIAYGVTTGFGAFKDRVIERSDVERLQRNIVVSHATGMGEPFDEPTARAIMLIRAATLAQGHSGIRPETLELLIGMLEAGIVPVIPRKGSLGASGDLAPLAHMALVMIGEGEAFFGGERVPGAVALKQAGLEPARLAAKEGLALTNGTALMAGVGALEASRAEMLCRVADIAGCLSLEALSGTTAALDPRIHAARPYPRQIACAAYMRSLLDGSELTRGHDPTNVQDAYTLRCMPQVHGAVRDAVAYALWVVGIELNSVTDNPLLFLDDSGKVEVISGGNFHGEPLAIAMDYLGIAISDLGNISERRTMRLTDEASNAHTLPAFLTREGGLNSGFMLTQYTAAALATENKILAHPASVDTIPTSANVEDHVSMGATAAVKARDIISNVERILAIELFAAAQAVDLRREIIGRKARLGAGTAPVYELIRKHVPFIEEDTVMAPHMEAVRELIAAGAIARAAESAVSPPANDPPVTLPPAR